MSRRKVYPLREMAKEERAELEVISRERSGPAEGVTRAKLLLRVSEGAEYETAAREVGRRDGDRVAAIVKRFNEEGLAALASRHGGGPKVVYGVAERERILREVQRQPSCETDGTASWSLSTLQRSLREASDGLGQVSQDTIRKVLLEAGYNWQSSRSWCQTGEVVRQRKAGPVVVTDPDSEAKKNSLNKPTSSPRCSV
jgi:transposase